MNKVHNNKNKKNISGWRLAIPLVLAIFLLLPAAAEADIVIGTVRSAADVGASSIDITNVSISGSNRALVVAVCFNNNEYQVPVSVILDPSGVNIPLTWLDNAAGISGGDDGHCTIWGVKNPPTGTYTVRVTINPATNSSEGLIAGAWPLTGVDQTTPFGTAVGVSGAGADSASITVTSAIGDIVLAAGWNEYYTSGNTMDTSGTGIEDYKTEADGDDVSVGQHKDGEADDTTLTWTNDAKDDKWAAIGVAVRPAGTTIGGGTSPANKDVQPDSTNNAVDAFTLYTNSAGTIDTVTALEVTLTGTAADVATSGVKIYDDSTGGTPNEWDAGDMLKGTASFSGTTADVTVSISVDSTPTQYLVTYDIATDATESNTLQGAITDATVLNILTNNDTIDATLTVVCPTCPGGSVCWDGGGSTNNWSEGANWTGDAVPGSEADVVFNGLSTKDATFNAADTIGSLTLASGYADTLTLAATLTNDGTFIMNAGTLNMGSATINQNDDWTYTAGTVDAGTSNVIMASAEFDVNSGAMAFNDVTLSLGGNGLYVTGTMDVDGDLTINSVDCISTGTIAVSGNVTTTDTAVCSSNGGKILIDGDGPQTLSALGGAGGLPIIEINNSGTLTIEDTIHMDDNWIFTGGAVDAGTSTVIFDGSDLSITTGAMAFNNVTVDYGGSGNTVTLNDTLDIDGNLTLTAAGDGFSGAGDIEVAGNLTSTDASVGGSNAITLDGDNPQTIDISTGDLTSGLFTINKTNPTDTVTLISAMSLSDTDQDLTITQGVLAIGAYDLTVDDVLTVDTNGDITCAGGTITASSQIGTGLPYSCGAVPSVDQANFQFFEGTGALPEPGSTVSPVIQDTDTHQDGSNSTSATLGITIPDYSIGDLIIVAINIWQDDNADTDVSWPSAPEGETVTSIETGYGGSDSNDLPMIALGWWIGTGSHTGANWDVTTDDATRFASAVIIVPAGEFDATTPIGATGKTFNLAGNDPNFGNFTANSDDTDGKLLAFIAIDQDPITGTPTNWTMLERLDQGRASIELAIRDAAVTSSESITSPTTWTGVSDAYTGYGFIVRPAVGAGTGRTALDVAGADVSLDADTEYGWQFRLENTGDGSADDQYKIRYKHIEGTNTWTDVTSSSSVIRATLTDDFANGVDVPEYIGGSGTYVSDNNAALESTGALDLEATTLAGTSSFEGHLNFQILSSNVSHNDTIQLQVWYGDTTVLEAYTDTPTITVTVRDCTFSYRKEITIQSSQVIGSSNHLNFPMLVSLSGDWLKTTTEDPTNGRIENDPDGYDIIFKDSNGTQLDHEIEDYDGTSLGGTLVAWVRIPTLDYDDDTVIYMYYGTPCIDSSLENAAGVWNDDYAGVWHLSQTPDTDGGTSEILDSNNSNHGDSNNMGAGNLIDGRIDGALNFDGTDEYVEILHHSSIDFADVDFSYSFWIKALEADFAHNDRILNKGTSSVVGCGNGNRYEFTWADTVIFSAVIDDNVERTRIVRTSTPYLDNTWHYVAFTRKVSSNELRLYRDGDQDGLLETDLSGDISNGCPLLLGTASDVTEYAKMVLDELRISNIARTPEWIETEFNNQKVNSTFFIEGDEDVLGDCSYSYFKTITIESDEVFGTSITNTWQVPADNRDAWDDGGSGNITDSHFGDSTWGDSGGHQFAVTIPQGATIISAILKVYSSAHGGATGAYTARINIEDVDNAAIFDGTGTGVSGRSYYATTVDWSIPSAGLDTDTWSDSPDIKDLIQYVVNKAGWSSGNYLNIAIWGTTSNGGSYENIRDYTDDPALAVKLEVTYQDNSPYQDFPFLVNITSDDDLRTIVNNGDVEHDDGYDIIFRDSYGTKLDHEIEDYVLTSGKFVAWVRIPTLSLSVDTVIYMYYGNSCISTSQQNVAGVWDDNYVGVWHLDESPANTVAGHDDSTGNPNDGTPQNFGTTSTSTTDPATDVPTWSTDSKIDGADVFDESDDYVDVGNLQSLAGSSELTMSVWFNARKLPSTSGDDDGIFIQHDGYDEQMGMRFDGNNSKLSGYVETGDVSAGVMIVYSGNIVINTWYHAVLTFKDGVSELFLDGVSKGTDDQSSSFTTLPDLINNMFIGSLDQGSSDYFGGIIDEVRISDTARSAGWIKTCYYNQKANSTFYIIGGETGYAPTAVDLISFTATGQSSTVLVEWETAQEIDNLGFNLYRSTDLGGTYTKLNSSLIPGLISSVSGQQYTYIDTGVTRDVLYYYMLEDMDLSGTRTMHGPICVDWDGDGIPDGDVEDPDDDDSDDNTDEDPEVKIPELRFEEVDFGPEGWTPSSSYASWVKLSSFRARQGDEGIALEWETSFEVDNFGFHVYRELDGKFYRITPDLVPGSVFKAGAGRELPAGQSYAYWDGLSEGTGYELYWLDCVELNGGRASFGPIKPEIYGQPVSKRLKVRFRSIGKRQVSKARELGNIRALREELSTKSIQTQSSKANFRMIDAEEPSEPRLPPTEEQWALAAQPGVKIYISEDGWYRVGEPELVAAGLSPDVDPRYLQLYADGEEKSMMVTGSDDGRFDPEDAVEFYGTGLDTSFTAAHVYWLVVGSRPGRRVDTPFIDIRLDLGQRMRVPRGLRGRGAPLSFPFSLELKERTFYFAALKNGERENFFGSLISTEPVDQLLTVAHPDLSSPEDAVLEVVLQGAADSIHQIKILFNYVEVGELVFSGQQLGAVEIQVPSDLFLEGDNIVTLTAQGGATDVSLVDKIWLTYWRKYTADEDVLQFKTSGGEWLSIGGFSDPEIQVVDITDPMRMINIRGKVMTQDSGYAITVKVPGAGERTLLAFTEDKMKTPAGIEANLASSWHELSQGAEVIIIGYSDLLENVEFLKQLREQQGWSVVLVDVEDLYDEFNFGSKNPWALKDFLDRAYAYWNPQPRFVLLVGDASYDPRNYLGFGEFDLVPTKFVDTGRLTTASDDWFVDFDDDGLPEMAAGRLPVENAEEAATVVSKIIAYENAAGLMNEALLVADISDSIDFEGVSGEVGSLLPGEITVSEILRGRSATARSDLLNLLNQGQLLVNYVGHGSTRIWNGSLLTSSDAWNLTNSPNLPFLISMTCLNGFFQDPYSESLAETFLKAERGGAVAVWTSSGLTLPAEQAVMNLELIRLLFNGEGLTIGEAVMRAKRATTSEDIRRTWILFGDPTLKLR